jgi:hypothetical protein
VSTRPLERAPMSKPRPVSARVTNAYSKTGIRESSRPVSARGTVTKAYSWDSQEYFFAVRKGADGSRVPSKT